MGSLNFVMGLRLNGSCGLFAICPAYHKCKVGKIHYDIVRVFASNVSQVLLLIIRKLTDHGLE